MPHRPLESSLLTFLRTALQTHHRFISGTLPRAEAPVYVIGNPAADLDSIISAIVYSYFANTTSRRHVPLINLPHVLAGPELCRLRPEFVKALWLSTNASPNDENAWNETKDSAGPLLREHILTVADFATHLEARNDSDPTARVVADAVLVDWNALPVKSPDGQKGKGGIDGLPAVDFTVTGCVDHHIDEHFCAPDIKPLLITTTGSCTSLVVQTLGSMGLWSGEDTPASREEEEEAQLARLALAPILIDTTNLTAKHKVKSHDIEAYDFLLRRANTQPNNVHTDMVNNVNDLYSQVSHAKENGLDLLTVEEILDHDYKQWTETSPHQPSTPLHIGFCSVIKSIPWIVRKAGSPESFLDSLLAFARKRELGVVVVMTAFVSSTHPGRFCRELLVCALDNGLALDTSKSFVSEAASQLGLDEWSGLEDSDEMDQAMMIKQTLNNDKSTWRHIWAQTDVTKSRKQVAPLLRGAVASL
ncbi:hypothetical protein FE257_002647 [Aspergillus nanangensis]|uniref:DHHA2 domain-containing protein n=1 Tax=Aspergillus nanangensis TaxID=2582783 RepID=A0AAD4CCI5_ASPNN|nr:hypothetical protein FE257_002647 [Aspergillus nanangensis]